MKILVSGKLRRASLAFWHDESGVVLPLFAVSLVVLIGLGALALDLPRYFDLQTQLQKGADACALAAAAELDGRSDAEMRANAAIANLIASNNSSEWAGAVSCSSVTFYSALPTSDASPMSSGTVAASPSAAQFVSVITSPASINSFLPLTLLGLANNTLTTGATAVAGFSQSICKSTPVWVCSGTPGGNQDMSNQAMMQGREVSLIAPGGGAYAPGNFGFLSLDNCSSAQCLNQALGLNDNGACASITPVNTSTGQKASTANYFDTRFGLYQNNAKSADPTQYSPDVNVRDGYTGTCNGQGPQPANWNLTNGQLVPALPLPDDSNITPTNGGFNLGGNNPYPNATIGNGNWVGSLSTYWSKNYGSGSAQPTQAAISTTYGVPDSSGIPTRYGLYQYEITQGLLSQGLNETGAPVCYPSDAEANRRIVYAAVIDCSQLGGGKTAVRPMAAIKFFLLQPTQGNSGFGTMLGEYVGYAQPNDASGILHDIVQLYR